MTGDASRLIGWHWQKPGEGWFPASWSFAISMDLDFGLLFDRIICLVFCQAAQAEADKQTGRCWGRECLLSSGIFPCLFQNYVLYRSLDSEGIRTFQLSFGCHYMKLHRVGFFEELETGLFRNHIVADAVIRNPTGFLNLFVPPISVLQM